MRLHGIQEPNNLVGERFRWRIGVPFGHLAEQDLAFTMRRASAEELNKALEFANLKSRVTEVIQDSITLKIVAGEECKVQGIVNQLTGPRRIRKRG